MQSYICTILIMFGIVFLSCFRYLYIWLGKSIFKNFLWRNCIEDVEKMLFSIFYKSTSGVCFSDSARKMTQSGGRVVAIGSIFDMKTKADVQNIKNMLTIDLIVKQHTDTYLSE